MFTVKGKTESRKVTVMDFHKTRMITFNTDEIEGDEMEEDLKNYMREQLEKVNTGYWDYTGKHKNY
jgi:malate synthase